MRLNYLLAKSRLVFELEPLQQASLLLISSS
jgi:hypothetical protein